MKKLISHPFPPLYDENSRILILGSFPSVKSREQRFFYGHPQNRFWRVLADVLGAPVPESIPEKKDMLLTHGIALWDSIARGINPLSATIPGDRPEYREMVLDRARSMYERDKNHPSVFAFSLFNEPETTSSFAHDYFAKVFEKARQIDPQHRPMTGAFEKNSAPEKCQCYMLVDFMCLNRYYGWYISGGPDISDAVEKFHDEMKRWEAKGFNGPIVFTEFGTDTLSTEHKLPSVMWSQEYQCEYLEENFKVFDTYDFIQGELVWNFADFQTTEGIFRVNGNKKGVFTRERQPKDAAFVLKRRWENK